MVTGLADENIGLSFAGSADNAWSASGTQIIGKARSTSGSGCSSGSDYRSTLTITNKKTTKATLSFDYTVVVSEGTILVNNTTTTTNGSFSQERYDRHQCQNHNGSQQQRQESFGNSFDHSHFLLFSLDFPD